MSEFTIYTQSMSLIIASWNVLFDLMMFPLLTLEQNPWVSCEDGYNSTLVFLLLVQSHALNVKLDLS